MTIAVKRERERTKYSTINNKWFFFFYNYYLVKFRLNTFLNNYIYFFGQIFSVKNVSSIKIKYLCINVSWNIIEVDVLIENEIK